MHNRREFLLGTFGLAAAGARNNPLLAGEIAPATFVANDLGFVRLPDGRCLAFADFGDPAATRVILYHHGLPSCRLEIEVYRAALMARPGVRMVAIDRPGIGRSSPNPYSSIESWPADLAAFAGALGLSRFSVAATSAGTPYCLAAARAMPERVAAVSLACPMAPLEAVGPKSGGGPWGVQATANHPTAAAMLLARQDRLHRRNPYRHPLTDLLLPPADRAVLNDQRVCLQYQRIKVEAYTQGARSVTASITEIARPWAWWLPQVSTRVAILQGCNDTIAPPALANYLFQTLPNAELTYVRGEGHISLPVHYAGMIIDAAANAL
jgi:pimeloyl-ACP methyl ester carboxylesterase